VHWYGMLIGRVISGSRRRRRATLFLRGARRILREFWDPDEQWPENSLDWDVLALLAEDMAYGDCHG
jgi:hypothetical protein